MSESLAYPPAEVTDRDRTRTLFPQTVHYVPVTAGLFALGAYLGRDLDVELGIVAFLAAFGCPIGLRFAARKSVELSVGLLDDTDVLQVDSSAAHHLPLKDGPAAYEMFQKKQAVKALLNP